MKELLLRDSAFFMWAWLVVDYDNYDRIVWCSK